MTSKPASEIIEQIKDSCGMTQREIADQIGVDEVTVHFWATSQHTPHPKNRAALERLLSVGPVDRADCEARGETYLVSCSSCDITDLEPCPEDVARYMAEMHRKWNHINESAETRVVRAWPQEGQN